MPRKPSGEEVITEPAQIYSAPVQKELGAQGAFSSRALSATVGAEAWLFSQPRRPQLSTAALHIVYTQTT